MSRALSIAFLLGSALALFAPTRAVAQWSLRESGTTSSLRGLSVVSERVVWASGSRGAVLRTVDGGATWQLIEAPGADSLDFRDIHAIDERRAYVLSIGTGRASRVYKTTDGGASWTPQFINADSAAFYDCFDFWSPDRGLAVSDPVNGRFRVLATDDGGSSWRELHADRLPPALSGEAAFAASGACLVARQPDDVWIASGGASVARVYRSGRGGSTWQVAPTPMRSGSAARGIFALAFVNARRGIAVGGDYQAPGDTTANVAVTDDGGATWRLPRGRPGGYRSSVAYVPGTSGLTIVAVGTNGSDMSMDGGETWLPIDTLGFNTVAFAPGPSIAGWAVGPGGRVAKWVSSATRPRLRVRKEP